MPLHFTVLCILNALVGSLSAVILGLASHSIFLKDHLVINNPVDSLKRQSAGSPLVSIKTRGLSLLIWVGVGGVVDAILIFTISAIYNSKKKRGTLSIKSQAWLLRALGFVAFITWLRPFAVLINNFVEYNRVANGAASVERIACVATRFPGLVVTKTLCDELRAARYMLIPTMLLGAAVLGAMHWTETTELKGGIGRTKRSTDSTVTA